MCSFDFTVIASMLRIGNKGLLLVSAFSVLRKFDQRHSKVYAAPPQRIILTGPVLSTAITSVTKLFFVSLLLRFRGEDEFHPETLLLGLLPAA